MTGKQDEKSGLQMYVMSDGILDANSAKVADSVDDLFENAQSITEAYSDHAGFVSECRFYFTWGEASHIDLRENFRQMLHELAEKKQWSLSKDAHPKAGHILFKEDAGEEEGEDGEMKMGYALSLLFLGFSIEDLRRVHDAASSLPQYDGFEFTLPKSPSKIDPGVPSPTNGEWTN